MPAESDGIAAAVRPSPGSRMRRWIVEGDRPVPSPWRQEARALLELLALCGFAFTQPTLDVFAHSPEWFAFRDAGRAEIVLFALVVALVPGLALWGVALPSRLAGGAVRRTVHLGEVALLGGLAVTVVAHPPLPWLVGALAAAVVGLVYAGLRPVRLWTAYAASAPVLFVVSFLLLSPVSELVVTPATADVVSGVRADTPVAILVLDELPTMTLLDRDGGVDRSRFPNLAAFADDATWYRNTSTVTGFTESAVPAILTGRLPESGDTPLWFDHEENLFTLLGGGYRLHVSEAPTEICAPSLCDGDGGPAGADEPSAGSVGADEPSAGSVGADEPSAGSVGADEPSAGSVGADEPSALRTLLDDAAQVWGDGLAGRSSADTFAGFTEAPVAPTVADDEGGALTSTELLARAEGGHSSGRLDDFVAGFADDVSVPSLDVLHLVLPHQPWTFLPSGASYPVTDDAELAGRAFLEWAAETPWLAEVQHQRHVLQTMYTDALVGRFLDGLRDTGRYDDTLVVVVADHGVSFRLGEPIRSPSAGNVPEVGYVPLLVKLPGQTEGSVDDGPASTLDVVPTIADVLGVDIPWSIDGTSLIGRPPPDPAATDRREIYLLPAQGEVDERTPVPFDGNAAFAEVLAGGHDPLPDGADPAVWSSPLEPHGDLVGRPVGELPVGAPAGGHLSLLDPGAFDDVRPGVQVPAYVVGDVDDATPADAAAEPLHVALAVSGRIAAVVPTQVWGAHPRFVAALLSERAFVAGANPVTAYLVDESGTLHPLG